MDSYYVPGLSKNTAIKSLFVIFPILLISFEVSSLTWFGNASEETKQSESKNCVLQHHLMAAMFVLQWSSDFEDLDLRITTFLFREISRD